MKPHRITDAHVAIIGLGYVGLPLATAFGKRLPVVGFDINQTRIDELKAGFDKTLEVDGKELEESTGLTFSSSPEDLRKANTYIVSTPTPIDEYKKPNLEPILAASRTLAATLAPGDVVIYESTVYPGVTEEICVPVLEEVSGLKFNQEFYVGYSPERINPGDKVHRVTNIVKVTSGSTPEIAKYVDDLYQLIIDAGTYSAPTIKVAEAAKVIENTQRDVNIALMNELAVLFNRMNIDTHDVLEAAGTKWNFMPFRPGLVGGHCIGVDPYYLTYKAQSIGHHPEIILAGRRLNDSMGQYVASELVKAMLRKSTKLDTGRVLVMGLTFKEDTPDIRNTKVVDVISELTEYGVAVEVYDPWANKEEVARTYDLDLIEHPERGAYDGILLAVAHQSFKDLGVQGIRRFGKPDCIVYDLKNILPKGSVELRL